MSLAARVDAILAGRTPAPARSFTFPVDCRDCTRNRRNTPGLDVLAHEAPSPIAGISRVHAACARCGRRYTWTITCIARLDARHEAVA